MVSADVVVFNFEARDQNNLIDIRKVMEKRIILVLLMCEFKSVVVLTEGAGQFE